MGQIHKTGGCANYPPVATAGLSTRTAEEGWITETLSGRDLLDGPTLG